jgi:glycerol kinase
VAWVLNGQPTYAFEGITNFTGATISWLTDQLRLINNPAESEELAQSVPDNSGVYFVPAFVGLGAPYWKADAKGAIIGLTPGVKKEHIVRAALEGIGFTVTDVLKVMESEAGIPLTQLCADGGAVRNRFLMQFVADINHRDLRVSLLPELSALGAVFSGGLATGVYRDTDAVQAINSGVIEYHPQLSIDSVETLYAGWNQAIKKVLL